MENLTVNNPLAFKAKVWMDNKLEEKKMKHSKSYFH